MTILLHHFVRWWKRLRPVNQHKVNVMGETVVRKGYSEELVKIIEEDAQDVLGSILEDVMLVYGNCDVKHLGSRFDPLHSFDGDTLSPQLIKAKLDETVVSQDDAKKVLSVALWTHILRIKSRNKCTTKKSNLLLMGPSGSGKTFLVQQLAKIADVPFFVADATQITQAGFIGKDVDYCVEGLLAAANGNEERASYGIIFIDEIDKISTRHGSDRQSESVLATQQSLLKMIEGVDVVLSLDRREGTKTVINTSNIMIIFGGAFTEITDPQDRKNIGFTHTLSEKTDKQNFVTSEDLIEYGLIPEFAGRISVISKLSKLTLQDMVNILTKTKENVVDNYKNLLKETDIHLEVSESALLEVAKQANSQKTGARALTGIFDRVMIEKLYSGQDKRIMISEEDVKKYGRQR